MAHTTELWHVETDTDQDCFVHVVNKEGHIICETMLKEAAPLLAAAPKLLEACKKALSFHFKGNMEFSELEVQMDLQDAIFEAEGAPNNDNIQKG